MLPPVYDVSMFLDELSKLLEYLANVSKEIKLNVDDVSHIDRCITSLKKVMDILSKYTTEEFSFIEVAVEEFKEVTRMGRPF